MEGENKKELENIASELDDTVIQLSQYLVNPNKTTIGNKESNSNKLEKEKLPKKHIVTQKDVDEINKEMEDLFGSPMTSGSSINPVS